MVFIKKINKVARKVNAVVLVGAVIFGGTLMSFKEVKEEVKIERSQATVTHGMVERDDVNGRLYITEAEVPLAGTLNCGISLTTPCKITFDSSLIQYDDDDNPYVSTSASYTPSGQGPYNP